MTDRYDFLIIGGGIAGAGAAYGLAPHGRTLLLERESQPGYHTTGRSAALFSETYGNETIRAVTVASREFYLAPPKGFAAAPLLLPRGVLMYGTREQAGRLDELTDELRRLVPSVHRIDAKAALARVPVMRPEAVAGGALAEPDAMDIDVNALHRGFLRGATEQGARIVCDADVTGLARQASGDWQVETRSAVYHAAVVVNAAGAWCDAMARMAGVQPVGLNPKRRTALTFDPPAGTDCRNWPLAVDVDETCYFKPDAGRLLLSPADETPSEPCDAQPEEEDLALAIDRLEARTTLTVRRVAAKWAGLRSFVADKAIVCGFERTAPGFFWLAGQGGYGIQTAPAMSRIVGALACGRALPQDVQDLGVTAAQLSPDRLR